MTPILTPHESRELLFLRKKIEYKLKDHDDEASLAWIKSLKDIDNWDLPLICAAISENIEEASIVLPQKKLSTIDCLYEVLENISVLDLSGNQIVDVDVLLTSLILCELNLSSNPLSSIKCISGFPSLEKLHLNNVSINPSELSLLSNLTSLTLLNLQNCNIGNISFLVFLINLQYLDLSQNQAKDLTPLKDLKKLRIINLVGNPIHPEKALLGSAGQNRQTVLVISLDQENIIIMANPNMKCKYILRASR